MVDCQAMGGLVSFITVSGGWDCLFFFDRNMDIGNEVDCPAVSFADTAPLEDANMAQ